MSKIIAQRITNRAHKTTNINLVLKMCPKVCKYFHLPCIIFLVTLRDKNVNVYTATREMLQNMSNNVTSLLKTPSNSFHLIQEKKKKIQVHVEAFTNLHNESPHYFCGLLCYYSVPLMLL